MDKAIGPNIIRNTIDLNSLNLNKNIHNKIDGTKHNRMYFFIENMMYRDKNISISLPNEISRFLKASIIKAVANANEESVIVSFKIPDPQKKTDGINNVAIANHLERCLYSL